MDEPKVSILWINYNSSSFMDLASESLQAVNNLDYSNYELILVDNGSVDGSLSTISAYLKETSMITKIIRLNRNLGFTGGNNVAYAARDSNSKYILLLNNDAVPRKDSLRKLVGFMEADQALGAAQGVVLNLDEKSIDTAGDYLSELLEATSLFQGQDLRSLKEPVYASFADAAYSIFRIKAVNMIPNQQGHLFDDYLFGYFDDHMLGLKLWNIGFKVKAFPIITAKHRRGTSFQKAQAQPLRTYLRTRNLLILNEIANSRYKTLIKLLCFRQLSTYFFHKMIGSNIERKTGEIPTLTSKAFTDGIRIGRTRHRLGERIDIYKAPILKVEPSTAFIGTTISLQLTGFHLEKSLDQIANYCNTMAHESQL